jgi:hypothetical protein
MRIAMLTNDLRPRQDACDTVPALESAVHLLSYTATRHTKMSDSKNQTRYTGIDRRTPRAEPDVAKPGVAVPREAYKTGGRHAAITNHLYNWHSYKNWAEKIRGSWEDKK